jgi:hypothetical protein
MNEIQLVPKNVLVAFPGWESLEPEEQDVVVEQGRLLAEALVDNSRSSLAIGEHLTKLQEVLEPKRMFVKFLKNFHFSQRTAYRYMTAYQYAKEKLPDLALKLAAARGMNFVGYSAEKPLGVYTEVVKRLPPPETNSRREIQEWLEEIDERTKARRKRAKTPRLGDPDELLEQVYRFIHLRVQQLPGHHKTRGSFLRSIVGMLMTELGLGTPQSFSPASIPDTFRRGRGRPRLDSSGAEAQPAA